MKILVTGGAGFIGSHVVDAYINAGHRVIVIDNSLTGFEKNINKKAKFYKADIRDAQKIDAILKYEKPEIVNHLAAIAEVVKSLRDPIPTMEVNVMGTVNLMRSGGEIKIKKFIFSSTGGAIYGEPKKIPANENTPATPLSPYGLSKLLSEECIKYYARNYNFDYLILRYPNVYGPRQNPKGEAGVVAIFGELMKHGQRPIIFGDGTKTRDYVFVEDIAKANLVSLQKGKNNVINLGSTKETSDQNIFDIIAKITKFEKKPIYKPFRRGEVYKISLSNDRAKKILNWKPIMAIEKGIKTTINSL